MTAVLFSFLTTAGFWVAFLGLPRLAGFFALGILEASIIFLVKTIIIICVLIIAYIFMSKRFYKDFCQNYIKIISKLVVDRGILKACLAGIIFFNFFSTFLKIMLDNVNYTM